jgi:transcriptional regulator with XRE-family HTH domain
MHFLKTRTVSEEQAEYELNDYPVRVRYLREKKKLTLREVSEQAGCSLTTLHNIEMGLHDPHLRLAMKIVKVLGYTIKEFSAVEIPRDFINQMPKPYRKSSTKKKKK